MEKFKTIDFYAKCSDRFSGTFTRENGKDIENDNHPPHFLGGGDDVCLEIDLKTGQILNWVAPTDEEIIEYLDPNLEKFDENGDEIKDVAENIDWDNDPEYAVGSDEAFDPNDL